jgi:hypothetical protein
VVGRNAPIRLGKLFYDFSELKAPTRISVDHYYRVAFPFVNVVHSSNWRLEIVAPEGILVSVQPFWILRFLCAGL